MAYTITWGIYTLRQKQITQPTISESMTCYIKFAITTKFNFYTPTVYNVALLKTTWVGQNPL